MRKPGVLKNTFVAPLRARGVAAINPPAAYSWIEGTPITLGQNDIHGTCLCCMAWNAGYITAMRAGVKLPVDENGPFTLYQTLGGMPADIGLNPTTLFTYWQHTPINGYRLNNIESLALDDVDSIEKAIIDTGFAGCTAMLDQAQMTQKDWALFPGSPEDGDHAFLATGRIGSRFTDATWGAEAWFEADWFAKQGLNCWRIELEAA